MGVYTSAVATPYQIPRGASSCVLMVLSRPSMLPLHERPPSDRGVWLHMRLNGFERIQLLVVLWFVVSQILSFRVGLDLLPQAPVRGSDPPIPVGWLLLLRITDPVLFPLVAFAVSRRFPLWHRWKRNIIYYVGVLAALHLSAYLRSILQVRLGLDPFHSWLFYGHRTFEFVVFAMFAHGMLYGERYHEKEREELRLRAEMAESTAERMRVQVRALRMEWSPQFLTGTLESITELLARDVARAKRMLLGLSSVLRRILTHVRTETVRLEKEVELVQEVLKVETLQRTDLTVEWEIDEASLELPVPHMSLLTLVYQALQDRGEAAPRRLRIGAMPDGSTVRLRVDAFGVVAEGISGVTDPQSAGEHFRILNDAGHEFQRHSIAPDGLRLELRCASEPQARKGGEEATRYPVGNTYSLEGRASAPAPLIQGQPAVGRGLEVATYSTFVLFYTALALYTAYSRVTEADITLAAPAWLYVMGSGLYAALWWGSFVMAARFLSHRYPIRQRNWPRMLVLHTLAVMTVSILNGVAYFPFQRYVVEGGSILIGFMRYWEWGNFTIYLPLAGIAHGFNYIREYHAKRISELRLRSLLLESEQFRTEAELQALKAELNPHFLFNALNTVSSLMHTRVDEARRVTAHLSALLRRVFESSSLQEVSVEEEVEFIRLYIDARHAYSICVRSSS